MIRVLLGRFFMHCIDQAIAEPAGVEIAVKEIAALRTYVDANPSPASDLDGPDPAAGSEVTA